MEAPRTISGPGPGAAAPEGGRTRGLRPIAAVLLAVALLGLLTTRLPVSDIRLTLVDAVNGVARGRFYHDRKKGSGGGIRVVPGVRPGDRHVWYEAGNKVTLALPVAAARAVAGRSGGSPPPRYLRSLDGIAVSLFFLALSGAAVALLYALSRHLGAGPAASAATALAFFASGGAWYYSQPVVRDTLLLVPAVGAFYAALRLGAAESRRNRAGWALLVALLLFWGVTVKVSFALLGAALVALFGTRLLVRRDPPARAAALAGAAAAAAGVIAGEAAVLLSNLHFFGALLPPFYRQVLGGAPVPLRYAWELTLGPTNGVFVYHPLLLLALPGFGPLWRRDRAAAVGIGGFAAMNFLLFSAYPAYNGGMTVGGRFLLPAILLCMVPAALAVERLGRAGRAALALLCCAGFLVWLPLLVLPKNAWYGPAQKKLGLERVLGHYPSSPLVGNWRVLAALARKAPAVPKRVSIAMADGKVVKVPLKRMQLRGRLPWAVAANPRHAAAAAAGTALIFLPLAALMRLAVLPRPQRLPPESIPTHSGSPP